MKQITKNTLNANGDHILIADETWGNILLPHIIVLDEYYWKMHEWCHEHPSEYSYTVTYEMEFNPILFDPVPVNVSESVISVIK